MKNIWRWGSLLFALCGYTAAQTMLADITSPIETEFTTYYPHQVSIIPAAPQCDPGEQLEKVINLDQFRFSTAAFLLLRQNHIEEYIKE